MRALERIPIEELMSRVRERTKAAAELPDPATRREIRERAQVTLAEVAAVCGVSRQAVSLWEAGTRDPREENLLAYVALLNALRAEIEQ